jgi:hypothetical protein
MKQNETKKVPKKTPIFRCENCDYNTSRFSQYERHLSTQKHKNGTFETNETKKVPKSSENYVCFCGTYFNSRTTLWRHKRKFGCNSRSFQSEEDDDDRELTDKEIINVLIEQNDKLFKIIESGVTKPTNVYNNNINNIGNKTFNLNLFLNETCKDAINMSDFVSSIKINLDDLENTGRQGYIQGITNIFLKNLNNMEQHMRPLHCSDLKREILYIKNNNEWTKESETKPILTRAIKTIANENIKQIKHWKEKHPNCTNSESNKNNLYLKIVSNSMNGSTEEESHKNINKIISNVAKEVIIFKN